MRRSLLATRPGPLRRPSRRLLAGVAAAGALLLTGCQTQSPIQTDVQYAAADGVSVHLGDVQLRDLVIVSGGRGQAGTLSGAVSNSGGDTQRIGFALPNGQPVFTEAAPHSQQRLSEQSQVLLPSVPADPGATVSLTVQTSSAPAEVVVVPVLAASGYYSTVSPTSSGSTATTGASGATTTETTGTASSTTTATP